jgi:hypothetical protein
MNPPWQTALIVLVLGAALAPAVRAADPAPPTTVGMAGRAGVDPKADEILRKMGQTLASAKAFSFRANDATDRSLESGQKVQFAKTVRVTVRRPDAVVADSTGDLEDRKFVYSAGKLWLLNRTDNVYAQADVPDKIDAMFDLLAERYGITAPLSDLAFTDPYAVLIDRVRQGIYLGLHDVNGAKAHHLAFRQEGIDWQIWVADDERALPLKFVITFKEQPGFPQYVATLDEWDLSPKIDDATFKFTPPAGATRRDLVDPSTPDASPSTDKR